MNMHLTALLAGAMPLSVGLTVATAADIVDMAAAGKYNTLVAAVKASSEIPVIDTLLFRNKADSCIC